MPRELSNYQLTNYDKAKSSLVWIIKNTTTVKAAEARYVLAEMYYKQNFLENADDEIAALLKQKPAYNYWIAKGLILRTHVQNCTGRPGSGGANTEVSY